MTYYHRKPTRIPGYDYSACNYYFLTLCTYNRRCIFGSPDNLNVFGQCAENQILQLGSHYNGLSVLKYVVMPNHIHLIIQLDNHPESPDIRQVMAQYKSGVSREIRKINPDWNVWQRSFHDHIIRNQKSFENIWNYIEGNPQCWEKDCFYVDQSVLLNL